MKQIIIAFFAAMLLAAPAASATGSATGLTVTDRKVKKTETVKFKVNMHCKNCVAKITDNISFVKGVEDLKVSLDEKTVTVTYNPAKTDADTIRKEIEKLGYTAEKV